MKLNKILSCGLLMITQYASAQITVTPLSGVDLGGGTRATYMGTGIEYTVQASTSDSITSVKSLKVGSEDLKYTVSEGKVSIENYTFPASSICSNSPLLFELKYTVIEDEKEIEKTLSSSNQYVTVYSKPVYNGDIKNLGENTAAIQKGSFSFQAIGLDESTGDPSGWSYVWDVTDGSTINGRTADWTLTNNGTTSKTFTVTLKAINSINRSSDARYSLSFESKTEIVVYSALGITIDKAPSNVLVGDDMNFVINLNGGMPGKWKNVKVTVDGKDPGNSNVSADKVQFSYPAKDSDKTYSVRVVAENQPDGMSKSETATELSLSVVSWPLPTSTPPAVTSYELRGEYDSSFDLVCNVNGGCQATSSDNGWKYEWSIGGVKQNEKGSSYNVNTSVTDNINQTYTVVCKNYVDGVEKYSKEYSWHIVLWAKPSLPTLDGLDAYYDENTSIKVIPHGGYSEENKAGGWEYVWYQDGVEVLKTTIDSLTTKVFPAPLSGEDEYKDSSYTLKATNYWKDGTVWDSFMVDATVTVHPTPMVSIVNAPSDVYYNTPIKIQIKEIGGIKEGYGSWRERATFTATRQGEDYGKVLNCSVTTSESLVTVNMVDYYTQNVGAKEEVLHVHLISTNGYGNNQKIINHDFYVNIWPRANFAEPTDKTFGVREGDNLLIKAAAPLSGGYSGNGETNVSYEYSYDGTWLTHESVAEDIYTVQTPINIGKKATKSVPVQCKVNILGPDGDIWDSKTYTEEAVIYGRPTEPTSIALKGNGTSKTYIFSMPYSDSELLNADYQYTVASRDGKVYYYGDKRYGVCANASNGENVLGATCWIYSDGSTVYSDFVSKEGETLPCSWSDFSGRGPVTRAADILDVIESPVSHPVIETAYDMYGRRTSSMTKGSLYIKNGKKYIAK